MSEETKDQELTAGEAAPAVEAAAQPAEEPRKDPITIELEDLTEEGKKKIEESLHRSVADIPGTLLSQEKREGSRVHLTFEVARANYEAEQGLLLKDIQKEAVLPGYRKGKAPVRLLLKRLGEDAVRDTVRSVATNVLRQENLKQSLKLTVKPHVIDYTVAEGGDVPVQFVIEAEVEPVVDATEYKGLTIEVESAPLPEEVVAQRIEEMRRNAAVYDPAPEGTEIAEGDVLVVESEVFGAQGQKMENLSRPTWNLHDFKEQLPGPVAEQIVGKKVGETVEAQVPQTSTNRRGEEVVHEDNWKVTVKEIKRMRLPELDDEFAKDLGDYATLEDLKTKVRAELQAASEEQEKSAAVTQLYRKISEMNVVDVPQSLQDAHTSDLIMQDREQLARYGMRLEHVVQDVGSYVASKRASAAEIAKVTMLLQDIARKENLAVTEEDVEQAIAELAERQGRKPLAVRARLEAQRQLDAFREQVARQKINDFLLANNTVNKVAPKPAEAPQAEAPQAEAGESEAKSE